MLEYLVTSKVRRRLLLLLWGEQKGGTAGHLADLAGVALGATQNELKAMHRAQLVTSTFEGGKELYVANLAHPNAKELRALVVAKRVDAPTNENDDELRARLVYLGAPLRGVERLEVEKDDVLSTLASGALLARREPVVARALPLCYWRYRDSLDSELLGRTAPRAEDKHAVGFFVELAGTLGGDRRLVGVAESLRDRRLTSVREFFLVPGPHHLHRSFPLAEKWGFRMNMDLSSFQAVFDKFAP